MRIVIDTNVFISSFFGGIPRRVIDLWFSGRVILCVSTPILKEYMEVLNRFQFDKEDLLLRLLSAIERGVNMLFIENPEEQDWIREDPADNKFIACAFSLGAEYIVSGDAHLRKRVQVGKVCIVTPGEMLKRIESG